MTSVDCFGMTARRDEIEGEIRHLKMLAGQLTDQQTLRSIEALIANLEAEKKALDEK